MSSSIIRLLSISAVLLVCTSGTPMPEPQSDGSKCPNVSCSPPVPGAECTPKYERDDGCCPVWYCTSNGVTSTSYGKALTVFRIIVKTKIPIDYGRKAKMVIKYNFPNYYSCLGKSSGGSSSSSSFSSSSGGFGNPSPFGGFQFPPLGNLFG